MQIKIESVKTYYVGMTESQLRDLARLFAFLQRGDLAKFCERMGVSSTEFDSIHETLEAFKGALLQCQNK